MSEIAIDCVSENYQGSEKEVIGLRFNLTLNTNSIESKSPGESEDLLKIKFRHSKPVPQKVKDYVANNLGVFDLTENANEKLMTFELKINDINVERINKVFETFFAPQVKNSIISFNYFKTKNSLEWAADFKSHPEVPLLLQILENSKIKLEGQNIVNLVDALFTYAKSENSAIVEPWMNIILTLLKLKAHGQLKSFTRIPKGVFQQMEFDQRDSVKDLFFLFDNPINNYVFEAGQPGKLEISGRILNILDYEFEATFPDMQTFLETILNL
jgi:hypothetical protein